MNTVANNEDMMKQVPVFQEEKTKIIWKILVPIIIILQLACIAMGVYMILYYPDLVTMGCVLEFFGISSLALMMLHRL